MLFSFIFLGIGFILIPILDSFYRSNILKNGRAVDATVIRTEKRLMKSGYTYHPVFCYNVDGEQIETEYSTGNIRPKYISGTVVRIYYKKNNPEKIVMRKDRTRTFIALLFILIGVVTLSASLLVGYNKFLRPDGQDIEPPVNNITSSLSSSSSSKNKYKKITPLEAQKMMSGDVIILDVRTQEEFNKGHIENAILLPAHEVKEKAESVVTDKGKTILLYCETGVRSENASKKLIEMGYKKVFDFGGIVDWTGEIVWDATDTVFYNYFGGDLPPDIILPIDLKISKKINDEVPGLTFYITGTSERKYELNHDKSRYYIGWYVNKIESIAIKDDKGNLIQEMIDLQTENHASEENMYGFSFDDWNFDGYIDISLRKYQGGSMLNNPTYYWIWDNMLGEFVKNKELEEISDFCTPSIDDELKQITGYTRYGGYGGMACYYEYRNGKFVVVKSEERMVESVPGEENKHIAHIVIEELLNGKMTVTKDYYEDVPD